MKNFTKPFFFILLLCYWLPVWSQTCSTPLSTPYTESFDGVAWQQTTNPFSNPGGVGSCWTRNTSNNFFFTTGPASNTMASGASADHTSGTGKYLQSEHKTFSGIGVADTAVILSPLINLSNLTVPELSFFYHFYGPQIRGCNIYVGVNGTYTLVFSTIGAQHFSNTEPWEEAIISLASYANDTVRIKFEVTNNTSNPGINANFCFDDFSIHETPSCPKPKDLSEVITTNSTATLSWTSGGANSWDIQYGLSPLTLGSGTTIPAGTNPFTVTGLSTATTYDFYVRDNCGSGDESVWVGPLTIRTKCAVQNAPFTENFDNANFTAGTNVNDPGTVSLCWIRDREDYFIWKGGPPSNSVYNTGPSVDHTLGTSSGKWLFSETIGWSSSTDETEIQAPMVNVSSLTNPELRFWYHMYGSGISSLKVFGYNGNQWTLLRTISGQQQSSKTEAWKEAVIALSSLNQNIIHLKFVAKRIGTTIYSNIAIDDYSIKEAPTCPRPQSISTVSKSSYSVTLDWTTGGANHWQIEYVPLGFPQGLGTTVSANTKPFTITGLNTQTVYRFWVRDSCGPGDVSAWEGAHIDSTLCGPKMAPFTESFDGSSFVASSINTSQPIDPCYQREVNKTYVWKAATASNNITAGPSGDHTSGSGKFMFAGLNYSASNTPSNVTELTMPLINVSPLTTPELTFWYHMFGVDIDSLQVSVDNGSGFNYIYSVLGQQQSANTDDWKEATVDLSAYAGNNIIQIKFKAFSANLSSFNAPIAIDDFDIHEKPSCPKPKNVVLSNIGGTSVQVAWTSGGATNWQIEYGPTGFTPGSGTLINVSNNPFTIGGLAGNTTYDVYVRDSCGPINFSPWAQKETFTTDCLVEAAPYYQYFEEAAFIPSSNSSNYGSFSACWPRENQFNYNFWSSGQGTTFAFASGPSGDHTSGTGKYIFVNGYYNGGNGPSVTSPSVDLSALSNPELRFWYHMYGSSINSLQIQIEAGNGTFNTVDVISGGTHSSNSDPWDERVVSLSSYAGDTVKVRFVAQLAGNANNINLAIDDFMIVDSSGCNRPTNFYISGRTQSSVTLNWFTGGASNWQVGYRKSGSGDPLTIVPTSTNSAFVLAGLTPSTHYELFVRDSCGVGDVSIWQGPLYLSTLCGALTAPFSEDFETNDWVSGFGLQNTGDGVSQCWVRSNTNVHWGTRYGASPGLITGPTADASGSGKYIYVEAYNNNYGSANPTFRSPQIYVPVSLSNPKLFIKYHMYGNNITNLQIDVTNGGSFNTEKTITGSQQSSKTAAWIMDSVDLSAYSGDSIFVRFRGVINGVNGEIAIDDFEVKEGSPPCAEPTAVSVTNITINGADVVYTGTNIELEIIELGQNQGSGTIQNFSTSPAQLSGLSPLTTYVVFLRSDCPQSKSIWVTDTFTTLNCPDPTSLGVSNIGPFSADVNWTSLQDSVELEYVLLGQSQGSGVDTITAISPWSLSGLQPSTTYVVFARSICGGLNSLWLTDTFTTASCPVINLAFSNTGANFLNLDFDASASTNIDSLQWDFGGGANAFGALATHSFPSAGIYPVALIGFNVCGESDTLIKDFVVCDSLKANIALNNLSNDSVHLSALGSSVGAIAFSWSLGDGSTSTKKELTHQYLGAGPFTVTLTVTDTCGNTATTTATVTKCDKPIAQWSYSLLGTTGNGMEVQFDASASVGATSYNWSFGDGGSGTGVNPKHIYTIPSLNYVVTLIVDNGCKRDTLKSSLKNIGIEEFSLSQNVKIFPNPFSNKVSIEWVPNDLKIFEVEVFDLKGRKVIQQDLSQNNQNGYLELNTESLAQGVYGVRLLTSEGIQQIKMMKH